MFRCFQGLLANQQLTFNENIPIHSLTARHRLPGKFTNHIRRRLIHPRLALCNLFLVAETLPIRILAEPHVRRNRWMVPANKNCRSTWACVETPDGIKTAILRAARAMVSSDEVSSERRLYSLGVRFLREP